MMAHGPARRRLPALALRSSALATLGLGFFVAPLAAQSRLTVDAAVSGGVASNPVLQSGSTKLAPSATVSLSPSYITESARTTFQLNGDLSYSTYFDKYRDNKSAALNASGVHQLTERSSLTASLGYSNAIVGAFDTLGLLGRRVVVPGITAGQPISTDPANTPVTPVVTTPSLILPGILNDPSLAGVGRRRQSYQAGAGFQTRLTDRDSFSTNLTVLAARAKSSLDRYNYVSQGFGWNRTINQNLTVSANLQVGHSDYLQRRFGDSTFYQPGAGASIRLSPRDSLDLTAGVAITKIAEMTGTSTSTTLNGSANFCRKDIRWDACLLVARTTLPSSLEGTRNQNSAALTFGYRISTRDSLSLTGSYSRSSAPLGSSPIPIAFSRSTEFYGVRANFGRTISPRLTAFLDGGVARTQDRIASRDANVEARVGIRYRFGAER